MSFWLCLPLLFAATPPHGTERYAVIVGNNIGGADRPHLWFAERDAERMASTLEELGEFQPEHVALLKGQALSEVQKGIERIQGEVRRARDAGDRALFLLYFSGHASAAGLELRDERLSFDEIRGLLARSSATVNVAVVDACSAGDLTQVKGARAAPEIDFPLPADEAAEGTALIASTAAGELAQESATLGGSFFTHYFEMALRGAGDADGDGNVTLSEAFRYTAAQTTSVTISTRAGPQHPTYQVKMSGRSDLVLSQLRRAAGRLVLPAAPGALYFLSGLRGFVAEVPGAESALVLGLPAGPYTVERRHGILREVAETTLQVGEERPLPPLLQVQTEASAPKGGRSLGLEPFVGVLGVAGLLSGASALLGARVGVRILLGPLRLRVQADWAHQNVQEQPLAYTLDLIGGSGAVLFTLWERWVRLEVGPEICYQHAFQQTASGLNESTGIELAGLSIGSSVRVGPVRIGLDLSADGALVSIDGASQVRPIFTAALVCGLPL